jgi:osmotically inducible protein OsmC
MKRNATAVWNFIKRRSWKINNTKYDLENTQYSFGSRFETGVGTNPEELIAAAHSGCFTMQLSAYIGEVGHELKVLKLNV